MTCQLCGSVERCRCSRDVWLERWHVARHLAVLVSQKPWGGPGAVILVTWCPSAWVGASDWTQLKGELELGAHMKRKERKHGEGQSRTAEDRDFQAEHPELYDYLTASCYDDDPKQPRITSTLLVFAADGCWKACLRDRSEGVCCWCAAPSVVELLAVLERSLKDGTAVWRLDRATGAPEAKRVPRSKST